MVGADTPGRESAVGPALRGTAPQLAEGESNPGALADESAERRLTGRLNAGIRLRAAGLARGRCTVPPVAAGECGR